MPFNGGVGTAIMNTPGTRVMHQTDLMEAGNETAIPEDSETPVSLRTPPIVTKRVPVFCWSPLLKALYAWAVIGLLVLEFAPNISFFPLVWIGDFLFSFIYSFAFITVGTLTFLVLLIFHINTSPGGDSEQIVEPQPVEIENVVPTRVPIVQQSPETVLETEYGMPPALAKELSVLIRYIVRDFISTWWEGKRCLNPWCCGSSLCDVWC